MFRQVKFEAAAIASTARSYMKTEDVYQFFAPHFKHDKVLIIKADDSDPLSQPLRVEHRRGRKATRLSRYPYRSGAVSTARCLPRRRRFR